MKYLCLLIMLMAGVANAQCVSRANIYYINGVNNPSLKKVHDDTNLLWKKIRSHASRMHAFAKVDVLHNKSSGVFYDVLYEFAAQKVSETTKEYAENYVNYGMAALGYLGFVSASEKNSVLEMVRKLDLVTIPESAAADLKSFEMEIRNKALMTGTQAILVSHSQGNMFANKLHEAINASLEKRYARGLGVLNVASPSSSLPSGQYVTIAQDQVINMLVLASGPLSKPVPSNYSAPKAYLHDFMGHNFANVYLSDTLIAETYTNESMAKELVRKIDSLIYWTGTFWDAPNFIFDADGNRVPRPSNYPADSSSVMVCFPGPVGGMTW